jgi:hypothetical protein
MTVEWGLSRQEVGRATEIFKKVGRLVKKRSFGKLRDIENNVCKKHNMKTRTLNVLARGFRRGVILHKIAKALERMRQKMVSLFLLLCFMNSLL